jgi:FecR protein
MQTPVNHSRARRRALLCFLALASCTGISAHGADLSQAVVRQKVNIVTVAPSLTGEARPAAQGAIVRNENVVRTGSESRAELEFTDLTLARLGSNSIFSFDAQARALSFTQGAVLFSKPTNSGAIELRSGAITAAITGSTGFISNVPMGGVKAVSRAPVRKDPKDVSGAGGPGATTMVGMLEGKLVGGAHWRDTNGREQTMNFRLGPGDMLIAQPGRRPLIVQFDIPRFLQTSPLVKGFSRPLPNATELDRAVASYEQDARRGFIQATGVSVSSHIAWTGYTSPTRGAFDASVAALGQSNVQTGNGGFFPIGGTGVIRGQLVWDTSADLDLYLILPDQQRIYFGNPTATFNNGKATAILDHDNRGGTIDAPPMHRIENISITGSPSSGSYTFFVNSFATPNSSDPFTLRVAYQGHVQVLTGTLGPEQNSSNVVVQVPPGG